MRYEDSWRLQDKATLALWRGDGVRPHQSTPLDIQFEIYATIAKQKHSVWN